METFTGKESDWNYAKSYLQRIDEQFRMANYSSTVADFKAWLVALHNVHGEIESRMVKNYHASKGVEENEPERAKELSKNCQQLVDGFYKGTMSVDMWTVRDTLKAYGVYLKEVMRRRGLDMPNRQDPGGALLS